MHAIIEPYQSGFIAGRNRADNTKRVLHLIDKMDRFGQGAALLAIDEEKAFDRVHWPFLKLTMAQMGFIPLFIRWVFSGYSNRRPPSE